MADFARGKLDERTVEVSDTAATNAKIDRQIDDGKYRAWLNELFGGAVGREGIYNNKELYTPSGNRRSFAATHYPVTVENIVKAMAGQNDGNSKNVGGFYGIKTLRAATAETFKSVDEMHKRSERLQNRTQEEADALTDALNTRLNDIIGDIVGDKEGTYNSLMKMDQAGEILVEIAETKYSAQSIITGMQDTAREAIGEKLGASAGMADDLGWACIWQAVKRETEARHPNIEVGSDAYWNIVRNRFEDVCIRTQVVDTVLTRSQLMRSKSQLMKSVTAFMSEPTKNYNLIRNAVSDMAGLPASGLIADTELKKRPWQHWYKLPGCAYEAKDSGRAQGRRKRSIRIPSR